MTRAGSASESGITLIEMLIGMLILLSVLAGAFRLFEACYRAYFLEQARAEVQQSGRSAIEILSREIRTTGEGVPNRRPCHSWMVDAVPVTIGPNTIQLLSNIKSIHTRLIAQASPGETQLRVPTQSEISAAGLDWSPGSDFEKNKVVYVIDLRNPSDVSDDHIECFRLAAAGGSGKITLPSPLSGAFPAGSQVQVVNAISYSINSDLRLIRQIDGVSNPVADGIVRLAFAAVPGGVAVEVEANAESGPETVRTWSTRIGLGVEQ